MYRYMSCLAKFECEVSASEVRAESEKQKGYPLLGVPKRRNSTTKPFSLARGLATKKNYAQLQIFRKLQLFEKSLF